ncbi:MAG: class I SAM-dependent methyltransferase [Dehalococcoidia bacterium]
MNRFQAIDPQVLGLQPGDRLLDVGCGQGRHLLEMSRLPGLQIGVDWERGDLHKAAYWYHTMHRNGEVNGRVYFMQGDAPRLPFKDAAFDRVLCTEVMEHVSDDREVLEELIRVLRPGGVIAISVPDESSERILWKISPQYRNWPGGHVRIYRRSDVPRMLYEGGVRPYAIRFRHSLEAAYWIIRLMDSRKITDEGPITAKLGRILGSISPKLSPVLDRVDRAGNYLLPKSIVVYGRKAEGVR